MRVTEAVLPGGWFAPDCLSVAFFGGRARPRGRALGLRGCFGWKFFLGTWSKQTFSPIWIRLIQEQLMANPLLLVENPVTSGKKAENSGELPVTVKTWKWAGNGVCERFP